MVNKAKHFSWIPSATCLPYLKDSPAAPFLKDFYYDGIGLSPPKSTPEGKVDLAVRFIQVTFEFPIKSQMT